MNDCPSDCSLFQIDATKPIGCLLFLTLTILPGCSDVAGPPRFEILSPEITNVMFSNDLEETPEFNILEYLYFYDGGGVSIGDINKDGLPDLYFTANMKQNRLYLNRGDFVFEDITDRAGVGGTGEWTTGTTMVDINADGLLDIYVANVNYLTKEGKNHLFINNGDLTFTEKASEYGLDFEGYSKHAAFFDYDGDGDLDMYLLNHAVHTRDSFVRAERRAVTDPDAGDRLYRNDGNIFTDVTGEAGIYSSMLGYGLAVSISDINSDGCPDIYVSNDFHENDYFYRNNCDGTFSEKLETATGHTSRASMGNDIADVNNDGYPDIFVADMLPMSEQGLKKAVSSEIYRVYTIQREFGYHPQLIRNTLQLNRGVGPDGEVRFSEIAQFAGVNATDWSWAPLFLDMDNDGRKDLFVTNGIFRRPNNLDYLLYVRRDTARGPMDRGRGAADMDAIGRMPHTKIPNVGFINKGDLEFEDESRALGFTEPGYSNGAAYGDLDNDGDLDLVTNNVNGAATIQRNMTREREGGNYLRFRLEGDGANMMGIGSKIVVYDSTSRQHYELFTGRGFLSSVEPRITVGVGNSTRADSVRVIWPDGRMQMLYDVNTNRTIVCKQSEATGYYDYDRANTAATSPLFKDLSPEIAPGFSHKEDDYTDFERQQLTPFMLSAQGPGVATGDVNNDGLDDFFVGGAKRQPGSLFTQNGDGTFAAADIPGFRQDAVYEDVDAELFDANGDGALDLYVVSGGNEFSYGAEGLRDRFYFNDRNGDFIRVGDVFPGVFENGSVAAAADYDSDGDNDLFVGSRSVPNNYGISPDSHLFRNRGDGSFEEVTDEVAPELRQIGMVTDAAWADLDHNGAPDLIIAGEWMPLTILFNSGGELATPEVLPGLDKTDGWWQSIGTGDFDNDGDIDFVAGNMGTNSFLKAGPDEPIVLYLNDFDEDGQVDPIIGYTRDGEEYPVAPRDELLTPFEFLRPKFRSYREYAGKTIQQIFGESLTEGVWERKVVHLLESVFIENVGGKSFEIRPLPAKAQWSPIFAIAADDYDGDGNLDILTGGNLYDVKPSVGGRYDAGYGLYLSGNGDGSFHDTDMQKSGFFAEGEVRDIVRFAGRNGNPSVLVARNNLPLLFFAPVSAAAQNATSHK